MPAYAISEVEVLDEDKAQQYRELASSSIAAHGGRYIVRGQDPEVPEGNWSHSCRLVIVEFPTIEALHSWYDSEEYAPALAIRETALRRRLLFADGIPPT